MSTHKKYPEDNPDPTMPSKVAETAVAAYTVSPAAAKRTPVTKSHRLAGLEASNEVWEFAQKHGLASHLETAVRLVNESFHDIKKIYLTFEPDPEIPKLDGIAINIKAGGNLDELTKQDQVFALRFAKGLPNESRSKISLFVGSA